MTNEHQEYEKEPGGTLIRGADGEMYFVPDEKLEAFRVPEETGILADKLLYHQHDYTFLSALRGRIVQRTLGLRAGEETTVSVVNLGATRQWRP